MTSGLGLPPLPEVYTLWCEGGRIRTPKALPLYKWAKVILPSLINVHILVSFPRRIRTNLSTAHQWPALLRQLPTWSLFGYLTKCNMIMSLYITFSLIYWQGDMRKLQNFILYLIHLSFAFESCAMSMKFPKYLTESVSSWYIYI
jgi:hypothetical protein